jgi:hypothetical protein
MAHHLDLREFVATGRFFGFDSHTTRDDVIAVLGNPDDTGGVTKRQPRGICCVYGGIELHFGPQDTDCLSLLHFDDPNLPPAGSESLMIDPWVLTDGLLLDSLSAACKECRIDISHVCDVPVRLYRASSGVDFFFYDPHDPDRTGLSAVSLSYSDDDCYNRPRRAR